MNALRSPTRGVAKNRMKQKGRARIRSQRNWKGERCDSKLARNWKKEVNWT